jgi:hypothetical protein
MVFEFLRRGPVAAAPVQVPETKASATGRVVAMQGGGRVVWSPRDTLSLTKTGFQNNPVGFRAVNALPRPSRQRGGVLCGQ